MITDLIDGFLADIANQRLVDSDRVQNMLLDIRSAYTAESETESEFWTVIADLLAQAQQSYAARDTTMTWIPLEIEKTDIETLKGAM